MRLADNPCQHKCGWGETIVGGKLSQARGVVVNDRSGGDAMDEVAGQERLVGERAGKGWSAGSNHFGNANTCSFQIVDEFHQLSVTSLCRHGSFRFCHRSELAVVVVQSAEV